MRGVRGKWKEDKCQCLVDTCLAGSAEKFEGLEVCKDIRTQQEFANTKIIVTSIFHDKELVLNSGADLYLPKPFELSHLVKWVKNFMDEVNF